MVARHDVLRSYVKEVDGQPRQEILPSLRIALPVIDLTHLPDEQAETEAKRLFSEDARQLYDLANAPLMRATLVKLAEDNHVFILNFHHIIADGSSLAIFYKELAAFYDAARDSKTVSLPRLPVQYADYAAWQQEWLKSSSFDTQLSYWKRQLASLPEPCALPTDFDRPMLPTYRGARLAMQLSERADWVAEKLEPPAKRHDVHDSLRYVQYFAVTDQRSGRHRHRFDDRRTQSTRDRWFDRIFHQCPAIALPIFPAIQVS